MINKSYDVMNITMLTKCEKRLITSCQATNDLMSVLKLLNVNDNREWLGLDASKHLLSLQACFTVFNLKLIFIPVK